MADVHSTFWGRHEFLIRRLHSLSGLIPVGAYMVVHLLTNASVSAGTDVYQKNVNAIHSLGPLLPIVEWTFIFIPILFHAIFGFVIIWGGKQNTRDYPYTGNARYVLQRITGVIAFFYIAFHVLTLHNVLGMGQFDHHHATTSTADALRPHWVQLVYVVGVLACVYHLANGLWTMGITWGVWTSVAAQRKATVVCTIFGVGLALISLNTIAAFATLDTEDLNKAKQVEQRILEQTEFIHGSEKASTPSESL